MENWGLITFKESLILIDENDYSVESKFNTALTVCHEIGHQWFGNIVTMVTIQIFDKNRKWFFYFVS